MHLFRHNLFTTSPLPFICTIIFQPLQRALLGVELALKLHIPCPIVISLEMSFNLYLVLVSVLVLVPVPLN